MLPNFFTWMAGTLFVIVLVGFAPTLYLRAHFGSPELPAYLYAHGTALTTWFALLFVQALLIGRRRRTLHQRVGWVGAAAAVAVVATSAYADFYFVERAAAQMSAAAPQLSPGAVAARVSAAVLGFAGQILVFAALVALAILLRKQSPSHKRLMLIASIGIVGAAAGRWGYVLVAVGIAPALAFPLAGIVGTLVLPFVLLGAVALYDKRSLGRVLPLTWWSCGVAALLPLVFRQLGTTELAGAWMSRVIDGGG
jgi:hypothetical protein